MYSFIIYELRLEDHINTYCYRDGIRNEVSNKGTIEKCLFELLLVERDISKDLFRRPMRTTVLSESAQ